jgi:hypothetical protein
MNTIIFDTLVAVAVVVIMCRCIDYLILAAIKRKADAI